VPIGMAMGLVGVTGFGYLTSGMPALKIVGHTTMRTVTDFNFAVVPLFLLMGAFATTSGMSRELFRAANAFLGHLRGGLGIATIGKMTIPELKSRGYPDAIALGSLAGSGTLGLLIPPSIIMIVYGVAAEVSIAKLFIAGILPGIMLAGLFMAYVVGWSLLHPTQIPPADRIVSLREKLWASRQLIPVVLLIGLVLGSIYTGLATATESAALGVTGALLLSLLQGSLDWKTFGASIMGATRTSSMIALILAGSAFLSLAMGFTGLPRHLADRIATLDLPPATLIAALTLFFILLGCFIDGISMVVLTIAILLPVIQQAGFDLIWFGIFIVLAVEMAQITPPVGFNLFVLQGMTGRSIFYIARVALPYFLLMVVAVAVTYLVPEIVTWLPSQMVGKPG
jgi:tripartite ATP-independent transporter DctM subunit